MLDKGQMNLLTDTLLEMGYNDDSKGIAKNLAAQHKLDLSWCEYTSDVMSELESEYGEGVYSGHLFALKQFFEVHKLYPKHILRNIYPAVFIGVRDLNGASVYYRTAKGVESKLDPTPSLKIANHSPTGFEWGYFGSGPSQLALALILKACGKEAASWYYQDFKSEVVAMIPRDNYMYWTMTVANIKEWITWKKKLSNKTETQQ